MSIRFINQDITKIDELFNCNGFAILHIGNCKNVMNAGVARALLLKWHDVKKDYHHYAQYEGLYLGNVINTEVSNLGTVYTMLAQENYGNDGKQYLSYEAFINCLVKVGKLEGLREVKRNIYIPNGIGCGLAGGNWNTVLNIIKEELKEYNVYICKI